MSLRGIRQCKKILIRYSDYDGSSKGVREWMQTSLVDFASSNPKMEVETEIKRNKHPFVRGYYMNGNIKTIGIKNLDPELIEDYVLDLRNQIGRKISSKGYALPVLSTTPSIQGEWNEDVVLNDLKFQIKHIPSEKKEVEN